MCTLIALLGVVPGYPVVVAMNRDEYYDRPAVPPEVRAGPPRIVAPRDARAEGTWIGLNEFGVLAAVSNRFAGPVNPRARSRGLLCLESLAEPEGAKAAMFAAEAPEENPYNPFNLLHADPRQIVCTSHEGGTWARHGEMGVNVLTNAGLNAEDPRARRVRALLAGAPFGDLDSAIRSMGTALADHEDAGGRSICYHGEKTGTRSQTVFAVSEAGWSDHRVWYADGHPCTASRVDHSHLFQKTSPLEP